MGIRSKLTTKPGKLDPFSKAVLRELGKRVAIGLPGDSMHPGEPGEPSISNATLGYILEHGAPDRNVPARAHLVPGVEKIEGEAAERLKKAAAAAFAGDLDAPEKALHAIGIMGVNAVRAEITDGTFAPLSERTLEARRARGRTGEKPLLDTAQYRNAVTYGIVRGNIKHGGS